MKTEELKQIALAAGKNIKSSYHGKPLLPHLIIVRINVSGHYLTSVS
jgi:hypothetical protein